MSRGKRSEWLGGLLDLKMLLLVVLFGFCAAEQEGRPPGDAARGKVVFAETCQQCHDVDGKDRKNGPSLQALNAGKLRDGSKATHDRLLSIINNGPGYMPAFKHYLSEQKKEDLVAYMLSLNSK